MKRYAIFLALAAALLSSCVSYHELLSSAKPQPGDKPEITRACGFEFEPVVDERSKAQRGDKSQGWFAPVIPIFVMGWGNEGPVFTDWDKEEMNAFPAMVRKQAGETVAESGYFANTGKQYTVTLTLKQFYVVRWDRSESWVIVGTSVTNEYRMWPLSLISVQVKVAEKGTGRIIGQRLVTRSFLFNPYVFVDGSYKDIKVRVTGTTAGDFALDEVQEKTIYGRNQDFNNLPPLASAAAGSVILRDFLMELPTTLDEIVADDAPVSGGADEATFTAARLLPEYRFAEIAVIEVETGKILSTDIKRRFFPIVSAPDQWIVLPMYRGHWMSDGEYARLIRRLAGRFTLDLKSNLNAAVIKP